MPDISIIIVSWNVKDMLQDCLTSLVSEELKIETLVVDADSADGTPEMIRSRFPQITLIEPNFNTGFSKGNNIGIEQARGRYLFMLNPDTRVVAGSLRKMFNFMEAHPEVGVLGPQLLNPDSSVQSSRRRFPTFWTAIFESTWLQPVAPKKILDHFYVNDADDGDTIEVDWVDGAAMFARKDTLDQVGGLDEGYFMYSEEMDWQRRVRDAGWEIVYYPEAQVYHHRGASSDQVSTKRHIYFQNSKIRYFRKHHGDITAGVLRIYLLTSYWWQIAVEGLKWLMGHKRDLRKQRVRAYREILKTGLKGSM